jgi:predicted RNase H-like HicB family nuclease
MLSYPIRVTPGSDGCVMLTFHDVPEAVVVGRSEDEAIGRAQPLLETILDGYVLDGRPIPPPSDVCGAPTVSTDRFSVAGIEEPAAALRT